MCATMQIGEGFLGEPGGTLTLSRTLAQLAFSLLVLALTQAWFSPSRPDCCYPQLPFMAGDIQLAQCLNLFQESKMQESGREAQKQILKISFLCWLVLHSISQKSTVLSHQEAVSRGLLGSTLKPR